MPELPAINLHVTYVTNVTGGKKLNRKLDKIMADLSAISAAVSADTTVDQSAITLLNTIGAEMLAAANDPAAIAALAATLTDNATQLAAAVSANTPADPTVPVAPVDPTPVDPSA